MDFLRAIHFSDSDFDQVLAAYRSIERNLLLAVGADENFQPVAGAMDTHLPPAEAEARHDAALKASAEAIAELGGRIHEHLPVMKQMQMEEQDLLESYSERQVAEIEARLQQAAEEPAEAGGVENLAELQRQLDLFRKFRAVGAARRRVRNLFQGRPAEYREQP